MDTQKRTAQLGGGTERGKTTLGNDAYEANDLRAHDVYLLLLGIYPRDTKTSHHTGTHALGFTVAFFRVAPNWKPPSGPSASEGRQEPAGPSLKRVPLLNEKE